MVLMVLMVLERAKAIKAIKAAGNGDLTDLDPDAELERITAKHGAGE